MRKKLNFMKAQPLLRSKYYYIKDTKELQIGTTSWILQLFQALMKYSSGVAKNRNGNSRPALSVFAHFLFSYTE